MKKDIIFALIALLGLGGLLVGASGLRAAVEAQQELNGMKARLDDKLIELEYHKKLRRHSVEYDVSPDTIWYDVYGAKSNQ